MGDFTHVKSPMKIYGRFYFSKKENIGHILLTIFGKM